MTKECARKHFLFFQAFHNAVFALVYRYLSTKLKGNREPASITR